jgi:putative restriction endonuclease
MNLWLGVTDQRWYEFLTRRDVLEEEDGPMLLHGLQDFDGLPITPPKAEAQRPNPAYLAERFGRFRAA